VRPCEGAVVEVARGLIAGPSTQAAFARVGRAAQTGECLLISGESGSGKELAARGFHDAGPRAGGPFIAVNCAAIPEGVAERLLFGAKKGAYSRATHDPDACVPAPDA